MEDLRAGKLRFLMVLNDIDWFWSHRLPLARGIMARGWELHLATAGAEQDEGMRREGVVPHDLPAHDSSFNPLTHWRIVRAIADKLKEIRPDIVHGITIRYAFYTAMAARLTCHEPSVYTIAGLGTLFAHDSLKMKLVRTVAIPLMKYAFGRPGVSIIFQNPDDRSLMLGAGIVKEEQTTIIRGSGVDISQFAFSPDPADPEPIVLFTSRLLREKGIYEFVEAARVLKSQGVKARFQIAGNVYPKNPHSVTEAELRAWQDEGVIEWLGQRSDMPAVLKQSTIIALPSYYGEGVPKVLLETAAVGRPIITCDMPGCREAVEDGVNGTLIPPKDAPALVQAIRALLDNPEKRTAYGRGGRARVEADFEVSKVVARTLKVYDAALGDTRPLILFGMNEVNFDYMQAYMAKGHLPTLVRLTKTSPIVRTSSEKTYRELEPWIQWVSVQTGKNFSEHGVFRLGDVTTADHIQIWEYLESEYGVKVAALSPMNAANRAKDPLFFVPDPWTDTPVTGDWLMKGIANAVANAVNENATGRTKLSAYVFILLGLVRYSLRPRHVHLAAQVLRSVRTHYQRAILLDQLLTDMFIYEWKKGRPGFASLFLNGAAHLQHHYLFNAMPYAGPQRNPDWYMPPGRDPVFQGYRNYDDLLARLLALPRSPRIMVATGLHQNPVENPVYYWRLKHHSEFLNAVGIHHAGVQTRMSRDFLITFETQAQADHAANILQSCVDKDGKRLFDEIEKRELSIFTTLTYPDNIAAGFAVTFKGGTLRNFDDSVGFVAIKNGEYDGEGYLIDTDNVVPADKAFPITSIFGLIADHFAKEKAARKKAA